MLHVDNSLLRAVARCSTEAVLRYHHGLTSVEERAPLKAGSAGHEALAVWFRGGTTDAALAAFEASYATWAGEHVPPDDRLSYANTSTIVAHWLETHPISAFPFRVDPEWVEIGFAYPLDDEITFCGRMDAIVENLDDHGLYVLDHKFTGRISGAWTQQFRMDSQLSGYPWAAEQTLGQPVIGAFVNAVEFSKLPSDETRKCPKHAVTYAECGPLHANAELLIVTRSPGEIAEWKKTALHLARRYRDLIQKYPRLDDLAKVRTQGKFNGSCPYCAFHDFCVAERNLALVSTMLIDDPWRPYEDAALVGRKTGHLP